MRTGSWWGNLKEIDISEDRAVDERIILKWDLNRIDCVDVAQGREKWWAFVNIRQLRQCFRKAILFHDVNLSDRSCPGLKHRRVVVASFFLHAATDARNAMSISKAFCNVYISVPVLTAINTLKSLMLLLLRHAFSCASEKSQMPPYFTAEFC
jgi:hypothetical protein